MSQRVLLDTGPLVALIDRGDQYHEWARTQWAKIEPPTLTCEGVITEACFLLQRVFGGQDVVMSFVSQGLIQIPFRLEDEIDAIEQLLARYRSVPMSLADACLVRMAELYSESRVLTLDSDFRIYRKTKNQTISMICPDKSS